MKLLRRIAWAIVEWPIALTWLVLAWTIRSTAHLTIEGREPEGGAVFVNWHRYQPFLIPFHGSRKRWMLVSPAPQLAPVARFCRLVGLRLVRGASGERGREAAEQLKELLRRGESVVIAVDGPAGPRYHPKRGCYDLARSTGVPIIPVAYRASAAHEFKWRWDHTFLPYPFARITILHGPAIAAAGSEEEVLARVERELNTML